MEKDLSKVEKENILKIINSEKKRENLCKDSLPISNRNSR